MNHHYAPPTTPAREPAPEPRTGRRLPYSGWWAIGGGALAGITLRLIFWGDPGQAFGAMLGSFIVGAPVLVGAVTVYFAERIEARSWVYHLVAPMLSSALFVTGTMLLLIEGWICAILIIPLFAVVSGVAGLFMGFICRLTRWPRRSIVSSFAILPLIGGAFEHRVQAEDRVRVETREIFVAAPAAPVWRELIDVRIGGEYFDIIESTYTLTPRAQGTVLSLATRYRVSTHFNWYAGRVGDFLVGDFAEQIVAFYARRAERAAAQGS